MATSETTSRRTPAPASVSAERSRGGLFADVGPHGELLAYVLLAVALAVFLWTRIRQVDGFYLDEWVYVHGAEYMWSNLPFGALQAIPGWDRGPQRLYSALLAPWWGPFGSSTAYDLSHLFNIGLLVSAIAPAALLARRVIETPLLRVLGVALAVAVPWLTIGSHLLTENLAFPAFLWAAYAAVMAAERPSLPVQIGALAAIFGGALCRLNLGAMLFVLVAAVLVAEIRHRREHREVPWTAWLRRAARREALVLVAVVVGFAAIIVVLSRGGAELGRYGGVDLDTVVDRFFGASATGTRRTMVTYMQALVVGSFIMPFVLGVAVALAGAAGRLGRRLLIPSVVALGSVIAVVAAVSVWTTGGSLEERYVFYVYSPIALLAAAAIEQARRLRGWLIAAGALTVWIVFAGYAAPAVNSGNFFAAPGRAFWARVVDHRLRALEEDLFGWLFIPPTGWLLVAVAVTALIAWVSLTAGRPRLRTGVLVGGLALCLAAQVAALGFDFKQELYGTSEAPGGIALGEDRAADRETWVDRTLSGRARAAVLPALVLPGVPLDSTEKLQFWNEDVDTTVAVPWNGMPVPVPPGDGVRGTTLLPDGRASWVGAPPVWLATPRDDPRVQFGGRVAAGSPSSRYVLQRVARAPHAVWTARDLDGDGAVLQRRPATMTLDRAAAPGVRRVRLTIVRPVGTPAAARWTATTGNRTVARGRLAPGREATVILPVPACATACAPLTWKLRVAGPAVAAPYPGYGAAGPARPVVLYLVAARVER